MAYAAQSLFVDKSTCKTINDVLINFLWKNKTHYIRKSVILNSYNKGGLNVINFDSFNNTFKINWLKQYLSKPTSSWNAFPQLIFSRFGGLPFLLMCNYDILKFLIKLSNFHRQALLVWALIYKQTFRHRGVLFGTIRTFCLRNICIMITGLVMVWFWCNSCLTIKVFCSGTQNFFRNTKYP